MTELEKLQRRLARANKTLATANQELGYLKHCRQYWLNGTKNHKAIKLEKKISRTKTAIERLDLEIVPLEQKDQNLKKEMSAWTICSNGHVDRTGGATCPECHEPTQKYEVE